ncbi:MAG: UDP-N-acetylmuramoyl-tripeptide--D-alanyl-D-alanine ligase [Anaerolineae bacterium]|nr:UDP-N-acetylmuramoyl-tripeptide--D-alanyl-D-alanine ligase [Caldilineales bacterium]MDW8268596.1 UDP-N-acetylmuramoyl-tripeptide--D-alanyl-D-alanine ligase [Anaerolineae bacterium]
MSLTLADVYEGLGGRKATPALAAVPLGRFVIDSRQVAAGDVFVALPGTRHDGHDFIPAALAAGARGVLAHRLPADPGGLTVVRPQTDPAPTAVPGPVLFLVPDSLTALQELAAYWRRRHTPTVVGITGSVGKTSTKELTAAVLRQRFPTLWSEGNLNNEIGLPLSLLRLEAHHRFAVLEMGFYVEGEIAQLCRWAQPHIGVVTNIGPIHLERAGSMEAIFRGKSELVQALPADGYAVLNWDDDWVRQMAPLTRAAIFRYGLGPEADLWADEIHSEGLEGIRFRFHRRLPTGKEEVLHVHLPLLGRHAVHTALRAAAVGLIAGLAWEDIIAGLRDVNAQVRIEIVPGPRGSTLIDDTYNASPPSTIAALNLLADLQGRRIAVLGDMLELGSYAETGHRLVGGRAAAVVDELVTVGTLARWIADEAARLGLPAARIHPVADADAAFAVLQELIAPGDFVLIKGSRALGLEHLVQRLSLFVTGN